VRLFWFTTDWCVHHYSGLVVIPRTTACKERASCVATGDQNSERNSAQVERLAIPFGILSLHPKSFSWLEIRQICQHEPEDRWGPIHGMASSVVSKP
jgi:hypothetical protein